MMSSASAQPPYPRITVVTPSFRSQQFIEATMRSVLDQGYPDLEYIVLDAAGDDTRAILERYHDRLAYWRSAPDAGPYAAVAEGFARATGEVLCWLNADDMLLPRSLWVVGEIFAQFSQVEWISSLQPSVWDARGYLAEVETRRGFSNRAFIDGLCLPLLLPRASWIQQESTFFRKRLWDAAGGEFPAYPLAGDFALWCEFTRHAELHGVDYPLGGFRKLAGQRSEAGFQYRAEAVAALEALRRSEGWRPDLRARIWSSFRPPVRGLGDLARETFAYRGRKIGKAHLSDPEAEWTLREHRYVP